METKLKNFVKVFLFSLAILFALLTFFVTAYIVRTSTGTTSYNVNDYVGSIYNITIMNNSDAGGANITQVNITLPSGFLFVPGARNGTNTLGNFVNTSAANQVLSWSNLTSYLINGSIVNASFWFNATAPSLPGNYNITVMTLNASGTNYANISVVVNDTTAPSTVEYVSPTELVGANVSRGNIVINVSVTDNGVINVINISLYNSTRNLNKTSANSTLTAGSKSFLVNFTGLSDGIYYFNVTVNDSNGNKNTTAGTRTVRVDTVEPIVTLIAPADEISSTTTAYNFTFNVTDTDGSGVQSCSLVINDEIRGSSSSIDSSGETNGIYLDFVDIESYDGYADGTRFSHSWGINCTDYANNVANSGFRTLTVLTSEAVVAATSLRSGGSSGSPVYTATTEKLAIGYKVTGMKANYQIKFKLNNNEQHTFKINSITTDKVAFTLSSTPMQDSLGIGQTKNYDLNNDGYYDLKVSVQSVSKVSGVSLTLQSINEKSQGTTSAAQPAGTNENTNTQTQDNAASSPQTNGTSIFVWIIVIVCIIVVVAIILVKTTSKPALKHRNI